MVKINRIYTRTGDDGTTGLVGGIRVAKDNARVEAYGALDELNAWLGNARTIASQSLRAEIESKLSIIQNELFDIGAELASPQGADLSKLPVVRESAVKQMESWIDAMTYGLPELRSFVLPGGTILNATLHICRSICRRCERRIISLHHQEPVSEPVRHYINRLSDLLFAMARFESHASKVPEYLWKPGGKNENRSS